MQKKLSIQALIAIGVGSMLGSGVFALPQNMAHSAGPAATIIAWGITGIGVFGLAAIFYMLTRHKPEVSGGIYGYARKGFGDFIGFNAAWGYWVSAVFAQVAYLSIIFASLGGFKSMGFFGDGNTLPAIVCASIFLWFMHFLVIKGIKEASTINIGVTIIKVLPVIIFVVIGITFFNYQTFTSDFLGQNRPEIGDIYTQFQGAMAITLWAFIGIEGVPLFINRAKNSKDVATATYLSFFVVLLLLIAVSLLSMGIVSTDILAKMSNPSTAGVLHYVVGHWGYIMMRITLIVSIIGAFLAWTLLAAEIIYRASQDNVLPKFLKRSNAKEVPVAAVLATNIAVQIFLILSYGQEAVFLKLVYLATSMVLIPYFFASLYGLKVARTLKKHKGFYMVMALIALGYSIFLVYAAGIKYLLTSSILYAAGMALYIIAKKQKGIDTKLTASEKIITSVLFILAAIALTMIVTGRLTL